VRRSIMIALIALLALALAAPAVLAQGNGGAPTTGDGGVIAEGIFPAQDPDALPTDLASLGCSFDLGYKVTGKTKTITRPDGGAIVIAPGQNATLTNQATGETVTYNVTGVTFASAPDQNDIVYYVITGRNAAFDPAGTFLNIGRFTFAIDTTTGELHPIVQTQEGKGQAIDICEVLS
jgi:ABC-type oligopeptide transport system substrate-binding subunit